MSKKESGPIIECMYPPHVTHVVRGVKVELGELGQVIRTPGLKIEWTLNEYGEVICDLWDLATKHAEEMRRLGNIEDTKEGFEDQIELNKQILWDHIWKMPEWNIGKIRIYVPYEVKEKNYHEERLSTVPPEIIEEYAKNLKTPKKQEIKADAGG